MSQCLNQLRQRVPLYILCTVVFFSGGKLARTLSWPVTSFYCQGQANLFRALCVSRKTVEAFYFTIWQSWMGCRAGHPLLDNDVCHYVTNWNELAVYSRCFRNIDILERFQSKVLRTLTDAPRYVPATVIRRDLTLRLLMSYIYGAPSKARNANVVYIWTYVWQRWNSLFPFAAQCFNTESMQRDFLCHICV